MRLEALKYLGTSTRFLTEAKSSKSRAVIPEPDFPSAVATPAWRQSAVSQFRALAAQHKPVAVLHHPHTTVTTGTWARHWQKPLKELPLVTEYLGAGAYTYRDFSWKKRNTLAEVLSDTQRGKILDVVVRLSCGVSLPEAVSDLKS